jgi:hypothetical protein
MLPPVAAYRDRHEIKSRIRRPVLLPWIEGINLESSLCTICGAFGMDGWAFLHARRAAPCTGGE